MTTPPDSQLPVVQSQGVHRLESGHTITTAQSAALNRYTDPGALIDRLLQFNWNPDSEISEVIELARQDENLNVKMRAIQYLRQLVTDSMTQSGMIGTLTQSKKVNGVSTTLSTKVVANALPYYKQPNINTLVPQKGDSHDQEEIPTDPEDTSSPESTIIGDHKPPTGTTENFPGISCPIPDSSDSEEA